MKKVIALTLAVGLMIGIFSGCGSNDNSKKDETSKETPSKVTEKKDVTVSYMVSQGEWLQPPEKELGKKFEEETGIKIDYQVVPADQYFNVLLTKLNAGEATDIFGSQSGKFDIVSQLNIEENGVDLSNEEWVKRMDPLVAEQVTANGKVYGLTIWDTSPTFPVVYNKNIFEKAGVTPPKTYEEFKTVCDKILAIGVTPIYESVSDGWHHVLWFPDIGPRFDEVEPGLIDKLNNNETKFQDSQIMKEALAQIKEIADLGYFGENYMSNTHADAPVNMGNGKYAMSLQNMGFPNEVAAANPDVKVEDFGFFEIPLVDNQILDMGTAGPSRFIYSGSKYIEEAKEYFRYITKQENLQYMLDNDPKAMMFSFSGLKDRFTPEAKEFMDSYEKKGTYMQIQVKYLNPQWMDLGKDISAMFIGAMTPEDILKNIDKRRSEQAKAAKDPAWEK